MTLVSVRDACRGIGHRSGMLGSDAGQRDPGVDAELLERVAEVAVHGVRGNVKPLGYFAVGKAVGDQADHRQFGIGQGRPALSGPGIGIQTRVCRATSAAAAGAVPYRRTESTHRAPWAESCTLG
jgi:hypothetical protein